MLYHKIAKNFMQISTEVLRGKRLEWGSQQQQPQQQHSKAKGRDNNKCQTLGI